MMLDPVVVDVVAANRQARPVKYMNTLEASSRRVFSRLERAKAVSKPVNKHQALSSLAPAEQVQKTPDIWENDGASPAVQLSGVGTADKWGILLSCYCPRHVSPRIPRPSEFGITGNVVATE